MQTVLEAEGCGIELANGGQSALAKVEAAVPDPILLDVMMPDMNGYEVVQRIWQKPELSSISILLVTAHEQAKVIEGLEAGANGFICKPIDFDELLMQVKALLQFRDELCAGR
ncbi:response regulator [Cyanobacteria bacterium FACHB-63]|nr:response regulator [Cyanobacteria bacterium FACHB-63]